MKQLSRRSFLKQCTKGIAALTAVLTVGIPGVAGAKEVLRQNKPTERFTGLLEFSLDGEHWGEMRSTLPQVHDIFIDNEWLGPLKSISWGMDGISRIVFKELPTQEISIGDTVKVWRNNEIALSGVVVDSDRGCVKFISSLKRPMLTGAGGFFYTKSEEVEFEMAYDDGGF